MTPARRLAAILAADVVGYSRLMGEDEAGTAKAVRERREAAAPIVRTFGGRLVKTTGDGVLLEFPSVVAAVECAIAIQKLMAERNAALPEAKRILYRVGVNLGDILIDGEDILGDGVNVAARLEGICEPGGICLSEDAYRQARGRIEAEFADLGEQELKNIARPVRAYALTPATIAAVATATPTPAVAAGMTTGTSARGLSPRWAALAVALALAVIAAGGYAWHAGYAPRFMAASVDDKLANAPRLSIVVLPFENLSGDKDQDYFADGVTDDLTTDLSHLFDSFVIARDTAMTYKGKAVDVKEIGRELGVRYALEGSVRRVGDKVTVNAQLISTETGAHVWADRFEGERDRLGDFQTELVARLANTLGVELMNAETLRAMRERPDNPDAVDLAMRGRVAILRYDAAGNKEAIDDYERALALDPNYVRAKIGLALELSIRAAQGWSADRGADIDRADKLVDQALSARPDNALALWAKAYVLSAKRQWDAAILEAEKALGSDRNFAQVYGQVGMWRAFVGRAEDGFKDVEIAIKLSPHDPARPFWDFYVCALHSQLGQWDQAIAPCLQSIAASPQFLYPHIDLTAAYGWLGRDAEAKAALADLLKLSPRFTVQKHISLAASYSDNPVFTQQIARLAEGLRKAGLAEGDKKTN